MNEFVSILMLTYNAPEYVDIAIRSVKSRTADVRFEVIVVDNASEPPTRELVQKLESIGLIDKLILSDRNTLFAEGNNIAARNASDHATHYLLLNSDVEIKSEDWLRHLIDVHQGGITSYGIASDPDRVDGYSLLIDKPLYQDLRLDEGHQWWWAVTKLQALVLNRGLPVQGYREHEQYLHHFGGRSGSGFANAKGMNVSKGEVLGWFAGKRPIVIDDQSRSALRLTLDRTKRRVFHKIKRRLVR